MKKNNIPPSVLMILSRFKLNEIFKLTKGFFYTNLIIGIFVMIIFFFEIIFQILGLNKVELNFVNSFNETLNQLSPFFFGGKFLLTIVVIYIILMISAKFDERWFKNWKFVFRIPVLSVSKLIGFSCLILLIGFFLGSIPYWIAMWLIGFYVIFPLYLITNNTFLKVYYREFPEEYKLDFGERPPK